MIPRLFGNGECLGSCLKIILLSVLLASSWKHAQAEAPASFPAESPMAQYLASALASCDQVEQRIPELTKLAETVARRHANGGTLRVIWEGAEGGIGPQGPQNELLGRSGGMSAFDGSLELRRKLSGDRGKDVAIIGWQRAPGPSDLEILRKYREKFFIIGFGPRDLPELAEHAKLVDFWVDTETRGDDRAVGLPDGTRAGRTNNLINVLNSWAFIGELVAALTREGVMPTMLKSHSLPDAKEWNDRYRGNFLFHNDLSVAPIPGGVLSRRYLSEIRKLLRKFGDTQRAHVRQTADLIVAELAKGQKIPVAQIGHTTYAQVGQYEDELWADPRILTRGGRVKAWERTTADDSLVLRLGYSGEDKELMDVMRKKKQRVMLITSDCDQRPDYQTPDDVLTVIDAGWDFGDACVPVDGYPALILPPSGVLQIAAYESINVEVLSRVKNPGAKEHNEEAQAWPPPLRGAIDGVATISTTDFLKVPAPVDAERNKESSAPFSVAKTAPVVDLVYHGDLPDKAFNGTGWTSWGGIEMARDGRVYTAIGNHGRNDLLAEEGGGRTFVYCYHPKAKNLRKVVDVNKVLALEKGDPTWSKVHAGIHEARDGMIYFSCTLNNGTSSFKTKWSDRIAGGQLFQYNPQTGRTRVVATFPGEVTPTTLLDRERNIWYANMEGKSGPADVSLVAFDLTAQKLLYHSPTDAVTASRNLALSRDGTVFFNGKGGLWKYDASTGSILPTHSKFPDGLSMRSSTRESSDGWIFGTTMKDGLLFRYAPALDKLELLGPDFLTGAYTSVSVLSPDGKYIYYLPGAHSGALKIGTPVLQYEIGTGRRKVLAFLKEGLEKSAGYTPGGTYGIAIDSDGSTLYVALNGHPADEALRPSRYAAGFGLTALAAIHIPASERP